MIKHIKTGNRAEISFKSAGNEKRRILRTVVEAVVLSKKQIIVLMPMAGQSMVKLPKQSGYEARFYTANNIYAFDVAVADHPLVDGEYMTALQLESAGEKVQFRDFYRHTNIMPFRFTIVAEQILGHIAEEDAVMYEGTTKDLSGGGMSFMSDKELDDGTEIYSHFNLDGEYIMVLGKVLGKGPKPIEFKYSYRSKFLAVPDAEREKILKFIHEQQFKHVR